MIEETRVSNFVPYPKASLLFIHSIPVFPPAPRTHARNFRFHDHFLLISQSSTMSPLLDPRPSPFSLIRTNPIFATSYLEPPPTTRKNSGIPHLWGLRLDLSGTRQRSVDLSHICGFLVIESGLNLARKAAPVSETDFDPTNKTVPVFCSRYSEPNGRLGNLCSRRR